MKIHEYNEMMGYLTRPGRVGFKRGTPRLPVTTREQEIANLQYGKNIEDLTISQRTDVRKRIRLGKVDNITFEQYLEDYKGMANDPDYKPKYVKANVGTGMSAQQLRARTEAKKTIEGFESKFQKNVSRRKGIKAKAALEADPEKKQIEMAKKAERRRGRRVSKLADKSKLSFNEKLLNFEQSLITRQLNDKIKANPNIILKNKKLMNNLSTTVDLDGNIIKSKPTIYELEKRGLFEIEHQRDVRKAGAMKDFPYNRNLILGPHNRSGGFKDMAEKFIKKNPDPNNLKVKNIIEKAKELKITLQPEVPAGTFKTKGIGYKQPSSATGKFIEYAKFNLPELVDNKIGMTGYKGDKTMLERGLKATRNIMPVTGKINLSSLSKLTGASEPELSNFSKAVREIQSKVGSTPVDDFMKLGIAQSKDIGNFVKKYGLGAGKIALKGIVIASPVFAGMEVMEASEKFKKGESAGQIVADIAGNWIVPGIGETYDAMEKNKLMKNIARPEELEALDKYNRYRSGQKMAEGAIELGEEEAAAQQMSENVNTPEEQLNLFKLLEKGEAADFYNKQSLAAERAARPLPQIKDYLDDLLKENND